MTVTIRPVAPQDRPVWDGFFAAYAAFYHVTPPDGAAEAVWGWIQDPANPFWCDIAWDAEGRALGFVQYQLMHRSLGGSMVCYLSDLFTWPEARGRGVGRALIDHVRAFARDRGLPNVRWLTQESNLVARQLYDSYAPRSEFVLYSVPTA